MKQIRVGIIGCGNIFEMHATPLVNMEHVEIAAVCDIDGERRRRAAEKYGCRAYADYTNMLKTEQPDIVHILLPHYLHAPAALCAFEHGADVVCEKPVSIAYEDAERMVDTAQRLGRRLGIVFQNRFNPGSVFAREAVRSGEMGRVLGARCEVAWRRTDAYYASAEWRGKWDTEGGGVIINQAIHTLDLMRWVIEEPVVHVEANISKRSQMHIEVEDTAEGLVRFASGIEGLFYLTNNNSWDAPIRIQFHCENGLIKLIGEECFIRLNNGERFTSEPAEYDDVYPGGKSYWGLCHGTFLRDFYTDTDGARTHAEMRSALETQRMVCDIYNAAKRNS